MDILYNISIFLPNLMHTKLNGNKEIYISLKPPNTTKICKFVNRSG